ncbi:MAG: stage IV sporulation protein A [Firmicutes bacterium]|nr:stage IV sporulation protein A [Bacillota bacterium]
MEKYNIFQDIAERTGGSIYIGVVGPVRTGKSTFIKRFMDLLVMPSIKDPHQAERTRDQLPQSGSGRTIMTTEPKFVPDEPVELVLEDHLRFHLRLVDCVGYTVPGAMGYVDESGPRMVRTPWFDEEITFQQAAEIGTRKVIEEHSTLGLVVVTDGSITDLPRENYLAAEEQVISELRELGKPFMVLLNSRYPKAEATQELASELEEKYQVTVVPVDCLNLTEEDLLDVLHEMLFEFPIREIGVRVSQWVEELDPQHWVREKFEEAIFDVTDQITRIRDIDQAVQDLAALDISEHVTLADMDLGEGAVLIDVQAPRSLFYQVLQELTGFEVSGDHHLMRLMRELTMAKKEYDKVADALEQVAMTGYGIVNPQLSDITFDEPELFRHGHNFGVRLKASAPSIHLVRANIETEVTPFVGNERQGEELVRYLSQVFEEDPSRLWDTDFLGRSFQELVQDGITSKLHRMPENAQLKLQDTLSKIINEGSGGLICIIL